MQSLGVSRSVAPGTSDLLPPLTMTTECTCKLWLRDSGWHVLSRPSWPSSMPVSCGRCQECRPAIAHASGTHWQNPPISFTTRPFERRTYATSALACYWDSSLFCKAGDQNALFASRSFSKTGVWLPRRLHENLRLHPVGLSRADVVRRQNKLPAEARAGLSANAFPVSSTLQPLRSNVELPVRNLRARRLASAHGTPSCVLTQLRSAPFWASACRTDGHEGSCLANFMRYQLLLCILPTRRPSHMR